MRQPSRIVPAGKIETHLMDRNSRFITNAAPAFSVKEAEDFINCIKQKYPDASHHVPVYLIGHGSSTIAHCSDAGEPSGTAGRPALAVLKGSGIGDIVLVITRYFGGTKLGTGGLVRAYSDSVRKVLNKIPLAKKVATVTLLFVIPYSLFEHTLILVEKTQGLIIDQDFGVDITLSVQLPQVRESDFKAKLKSLTQGRVEFIIIDRRDNTIMPLKK